MPTTQNTPEQTYEQSVKMFDDIRESSLTFADSVVDAFARGGASAEARLAAIRTQYQTAIASAIASRNAALASADTVAEAVWREIADDMARTAFDLADESRLAADRLATFQVKINSGLRAAGAVSGGTVAAIDIWSMAEAIYEGDGNAAGETTISIALGLGATAILLPIAAFAGFSATLTVGLVGGVSFFASFYAEDINAEFGRPAFDWLGSWIPDGFWRNLENTVSGDGAARLDPTGAVYVSMLLHRIDNNVSQADLGALFDKAGSAREGRETVALLNALANVLVPNASALPNNATDEQIIAFAGRIAAVTDQAPGAFRISATPATAVEAKTDFSAFLALHTLSPVWAKTNDPAALALLRTANTQLATDWQADRNARLYGDTDYAYTFTDQWYNDRAAMVGLLQSRNLGEYQREVLVTGSPVLYSDRESETTIELGLGGPNVEKPRVVFGSDASEADIDGSTRNDRLYGGAGNDSLNGLAGDDYLEGGTDNDSLSGGEDNDTLLGGAGTDTLLGDDGHDVLMGGTGNDVLGGGAGNDALYGGAGNDYLYGAEDNDFLNGGQGQDTLEGGIGNDYLFDESTADQTAALRGEDGHDVLDARQVQGQSTLEGGAGRDWIRAGSGINTMAGGAGADWIEGGAQVDSVSGGDGADHISTGAGNDDIAGGAGADFMQGGAWGVEHVRTFNSAGFSNAAGLKRGMALIPEAMLRNDHLLLGGGSFPVKHGAQAACGTSARPKHGRPCPRTDPTPPPQTRSSSRSFA